MAYRTYRLSGAFTHCASQKTIKKSILFSFYFIFCGGMKKEHHFPCQRNALIMDQQRTFLSRYTLYNMYIQVVHTTRVYSTPYQHPSLGEHKDTPPPLDITLVRLCTQCALIIARPSRPGKDVPSTRGEGAKNEFRLFVSIHICLNGCRI